jgi:MscS family membrane protein
MTRTRLLSTGLFISILARSIPVAAQAPVPPTVKREASGRQEVEVVNVGLGRPPSSWDLSTPRRSVETFLEVARGGHYRLAGHLLDLSSIPAGDQAGQGKRLARRLAVVLRHIHPGGFGALSNDPSGAAEKSVSSDEEVVARTRIDGSEIQIRLSRHPIKGATAIWLFSGATVGEIDSLYQHQGEGWAGDHLPAVFLDWQLWGIQLWQWIGLSLAVLLALILGTLAALVGQRVLLRLAAITPGRWDDALVKRTRGPLVIALGVGILVLLLPALSLGPAPSAVLLGLAKLLAILSLGWFLVRIIDVVGELFLGHYRERKDSMGMAMVPVARKMLKPLVIAILLVVVLQNAGMNVGGLLAGLGIGGLALALSAKSTLENLLGSIIISIDRPFGIGDTIKVGDLSGTVEDLGLRSTRLRTLERTVVTIPNAQMADAKVENFGRRDRMRFFTRLGLQHDTTPDQLRFMVDEAKRYLLAHPRVIQDSFSVRFIGFADWALSIEVIAYVSTSDWDEFTGIREAMLMDMGDLVERSGSRFALPTRTVCVGKDRPVDQERARQAAAVVASRREAQELCLPEIPDGVRQSIGGEGPARTV